jgi:uncharacterized NAD(P)/FAD-binding protein YdhS
LLGKWFQKGAAMTHITVIGAGLSGRLLALNLIRLAASQDSLRLVDRGDHQYMGPAYSAQEDYLLLNVPAERMSAISQDPEHFLKWAQEQGVSAGNGDFLSRRLYRDYILDLLRKAQQTRGNGPAFEHLCEEITDIEAGQDGAVLHARGNATFRADKAVLALGNFPPRHPPIQNRSALSSARYVRDPWAPGVLSYLGNDDTVFLIGTGQTTVDLIIALHRRGHKGRITAVSRRGLLPLAHRGFDDYPSFFEEIKDSTRLLQIFQTVRVHLQRAEALGIDNRAVIDSLRPDTQALWCGLPQAEKRRFLRHLFRYWEIIRSRIPPQSQAILEDLRASGQLEVLAGRMRDLVETNGAMEVRYSPTGGTRDEIVQAALVINTIGPEPDYQKVDHPLIKNLMRRGLIRPGPAGLGLDAQPNGAVIGRDGTASPTLYTLGSPMKGVLWEVIAAPEIRVQAERLAGLLLEDPPS